MTHAESLRAIEKAGEKINQPAARQIDQDNGCPNMNCVPRADAFARTLVTGEPVLAQPISQLPPGSNSLGVIRTQGTRIMPPAPEYGLIRDTHQLQNILVHGGDGVYIITGISTRLGQPGHNFNAVVIGGRVTLMEVTFQGSAETKTPDRVFEILTNLHVLRVGPLHPSFLVH